MITLCLLHQIQRASFLHHLKKGGFMIWFIYEWDWDRGGEVEYENNLEEQRFN